MNQLGPTLLEHPFEQHNQKEYVFESAVLVQEVVPVLEPRTGAPVEVVKDGKWYIFLGTMSEEQMLKEGLLVLYKVWSTECNQDRLTFHDKIREKSLFANLLRGELRLKDVCSTVDISSAQRDLELLTLRQLLELKVLHIDFKPAGAGADSINTIGAACEGFIMKLNQILFEKLGEKAVSDTCMITQSQARELGCQAVLMVAAAASPKVPSPSWWSWWMTDKCGSTLGIFFNAETFASSKSFPVGGVMEIKEDLSTIDNRSGMRKLNWQVELVKHKSNLCPERKIGVVPRPSINRTEVLDVLKKMEEKKTRRESFP
jgi:hypothetical protein